MSRNTVLSTKSCDIDTKKPHLFIKRSMMDRLTPVPTRTFTNEI